MSIKQDGRHWDLDSCHSNTTVKLNHLDENKRVRIYPDKLPMDSLLLCSHASHGPVQCGVLHKELDHIQVEQRPQIA